MDLFDVNEEKLKALYHRAWVEANYGSVNPSKHALIQYERKNG